MTVYAVVFSNYEPPEVDSLWVSQELAELRRDELSDQGRSGWDVEPMPVGEQFIPEVRP